MDLMFNFPVPLNLLLFFLVCELIFLQLKSYAALLPRFVLYNNYINISYLWRNLLF